MNLAPAILLVLFFSSPPLVMAQSGCIEAFKNPQRLYLSNEAEASGSPWKLIAGEPLGLVTYRPRGESQSLSLDNYLGQFCTTGFLVLHKGRTVYERYLQGVRAGDALLSASMSKTILSLLIGIAIGDEKMSLNDRVKDVLPDFKQSAFADVSVEELLRMTSGVKLKNSYVSGDTSDNRATSPIESPRQDVHVYLREKKQRAATGKTFDYNGAVTALLGLMLSERTGLTNTAYLHLKLWSPMGAASSGYWIKNNRGQEGVQGHFAATLSDCARLGQLIMNHGFINGKQVVPSEWIAQMTKLRLDKPQPEHPPYYGLHVWIPQAAQGRSFFWGNNGQNIFVDPVAQVVIVHTGNSPDALFHGNDHLFPLRDAITSKLMVR